MCLVYWQCWLIRNLSESWHVGARWSTESVLAAQYLVASYTRVDPTNRRELSRVQWTMPFLYLHHRPCFFSSHKERFTPSVPPRIDFIDLLEPVNPPHLWTEGLAGQGHTHSSSCRGCGGHTQRSCRACFVFPVLEPRRSHRSCRALESTGREEDLEGSYTRGREVSNPRCCDSFKDAHSFQGDPTRALQKLSEGCRTAQSTESPKVGS